MLPFLKAPADAPLMTDKHEIDARYRYWRRHILLTIWLGYALFRQLLLYFYYNYTLQPTCVNLLTE